jgi:hypothetical protein
MSLRSIPSSLLALLLASVSAADEGYDLRGPAPVKGQRFTVTSRFAMKGADVELSLGGGAKLEGKMDLTSSSEKEEEILGVDGREVTKMRTKIVKDETKTKTSISGMTEDKTEKKELVGQIVFSEKAKGGWKHVLEDATPTEKQKKQLEEFDNPETDDELYPEGKAKIGQSWDIKGSAFKKLLGSKVTDATGKGKSKFVRVEEFEGEQCAVIETELDVKATTKEEGNDIRVELKGKIVNIRSIKDGLDLKYTIEGSATFSGKLKEDGQEVDIRFSGKVSGEGKSKQKKK